MTKKSNQLNNVNRLIGAQIIHASEATNSLAIKKQPIKKLKPLIAKHGFNKTISQTYESSNMIYRLCSKIIHIRLLEGVSFTLNNFLFNTKLLLNWLSLSLMIIMTYLLFLTITKSPFNITLLIIALPLPIPLSLIVIYIKNKFN